MELPTIEEEHYLNDDEFEYVYMFRYKKYDELSDNEKIDKVTLLLSDQFVLEGEKLFRWSRLFLERKSYKQLNHLLCVYASHDPPPKSLQTQDLDAE